MNAPSNTINEGFKHYFQDFARRARMLSEGLSEEQFWTKGLSQSKPSRSRTLTRKRKANDPIKTGILVFLVLVLVMASIATFVGGVITASINTKIAISLLVAFVGTLRMEYGIVKILIEG